MKKISMVGVPAIKRMKILSSFKTELVIMIRLRHPRTVQVIGVVTTNPTFLGLVMEYLPGGSLRHALDRDDEVITPEFQRIWTSDVALGMAHLYSCKIEHRDLKSHNVLLTHDGRCKVTDFGLSRCEELKTLTTTASMRDSVAGTPAFMAPELFEDNTFTEKSDVHSYAIVLWEIYDRGMPWAGLKPQQVFHKLFIKKARLEIPKAMPSDLSSLMERAWAQDPDARPSFADICKQLQATTPRRPSSISRLWSASSPTAGDAPSPASVASGQGSTRSLASSVMTMFRGTQPHEEAESKPPRTDARLAEADASRASPAVKGGAGAAKSSDSTSKKHGLFSKGTQSKPIGKHQATPAAVSAPATVPAGRTQTTAAPPPAELASALALAKYWLSSITGGKRPAAQQARGVAEAKTVAAPGADDTETKAGEDVERKPIGQDSKSVELPTDKRAKAPANAPPKKAPPKKQTKSAAKPAARKPTTAAPAPAPAAAKKRGMFSKGRAAQPKPVVRSQPAPAPVEQPAARPAIERGTAPPATAPAPARGLFASIVGAKKLARKKHFAPASGEAGGASDPEEPADEAIDPEASLDKSAYDLCSNDSPQADSTRSFLGRTLDIF